MRASKDPFIASKMAELNAPYIEPMREFLKTLVKDAPRHALFLNMLAMLEHMGSRKIMMTQMLKPESLNEDTLKHLAEEARHAYFFKRQAEKIHGGTLDGWRDDNTLCRIPAMMYFGRMDAGISKRVAPQESYPWVSMIIELRACWLYHMYHEVLQESGVNITLKTVLAEEDLHLAEMYEMCGHDEALLQELCAYETDLYSRFWSTLSTSLAKTISAAA